jgi:hypothetical protein
MNTIAVALSVMPDKEVEIPNGLDISWKPKELGQSKLRARNFAEKSTYVYVAENLFEYLNEVSKNPLWIYPTINFAGEEKKAIKVYNFLNQIPDTTEEMVILCELLCHWRNRIVHASSSNASLSSKKRQQLINNKSAIYESFHHFDISIALNNFDNKRITLKDVSTLTTIVIKCCRAVDIYFYSGIIQIKDFTKYKPMFLSNQDFQLICKQSPSEKRIRQINKWISLNYPYLETERLNKLIEIFGEAKT